MTSRVTIPALAAALALSAAPAVAAVTAPDPAVIQAIEDGYIGAWNRAVPAWARPIGSTRIAASVMPSAVVWCPSSPPAFWPQTI